VKRRIYNLIWLWAVLCIMLQSALPVVALAQVSVRCVGVPVSAAPCMTAVMPISAAKPMQREMAGMACCRNKASLMQACHAAMTDRHTVLAFHNGVNTRVSAPTCIISIKPLTSPAPAGKTSIHRWLLDTVPALAPPACNYTISYPAEVSQAAFDRSAIPLFPNPHSASHGLRAPPVG